MRLIARTEIVVPGEKDPRARVTIQSGSHGEVTAIRPKAHIVIVRWEDGRQTALTEKQLRAVERLAGPKLEA